MIETIITENVPDEEWDVFVESVAGSHYRQSGLWAQVRVNQGWRSFRVYLKEEGRIRAGAQMLLRPVKLLRWAGYVPQGLLNPTRNLAYDETLIRAIQRTCRKKGVHFMAVPYQSGSSPDFLDLRKYGFVRNTTGNIDPPCTNYVDLTPPVETIIEGMDRNKRNQVRASQKRGLIFREGGREHIDVFYRLHLIDSQRLGYVPYRIDFYHTLWDVYAQHGRCRLFLTELDGKTINAAIFISHRDTLYAFKIGWSGEERNRYPNEAIHFGAMLWAKEQGYTAYDFGGFETWALNAVLKGKPYPDEFQQSYAFFKYQMAKSMEIFPPLHNYIPNPLLRLGYDHLLPLLRSIRLYRKLLKSLKRTKAQPGSERPRD